jgi:hypothetical protein
VTYQETIRANIKNLLLIDEPVKVEKGNIVLPARADLGAKLLPELFSPDHPNYRITRL